MTKDAQAALRRVIEKYTKVFFFFFFFLSFFLPSFLPSFFSFFSFSSSSLFTPFSFSLLISFPQSTRFCLICNYVNKIIPAIQVSSPSPFPSPPFSLFFIQINTSLSPTTTTTTTTTITITITTTSTSTSTTKTITKYHNNNSLGALNSVLLL